MVEEDAVVMTPEVTAGTDSESATVVAVPTALAGIAGGNVVTEAVLGASAARGYGGLLVVSATPPHPTRSQHAAARQHTNS